MRLGDTGDTSLAEVDEPIALTPPPPGSGPVLSWQGKRPPPPLPFHPADLRTSFGDPGEGWRDALYWGDNQRVLGHLLRRHRGSVALVYLDPPFASKADYVRRITPHGGRGGFDEKQYADTWSAGEYLQFMYERLLAMRELLAPDGVLWLQSDHRTSHHLRCLLEEVFGADHHLNTISWRSQVARGAKVDAYYFPASTQTLHVFGRGRGNAPYHVVRRHLELTEAEAAKAYQRDEGGFFRTSDPGSYTFDSLRRLHAEGRLYAPRGGHPIVDDARRTVTASNGGSLGVKYYLKRGKPGTWLVSRALDNLWDDVPGLGTTPGESVGYPTQKPEALLRRILEVSTRPGDLVFDGFMGSGTTQVVARRLGRRFLGVDENLGAVQATTRRLLALGGAGFDVYAVGPTDGFRNELEARRGVLAALGIRPVAAGGVWHGAKGTGPDRRLVRVLSTRRVATRDDLAPLVRHLTPPRRRTVLRVTLVCAGHEEGLGDAFVEAVRAAFGDPQARVDVELADVPADARKVESHAQVAVRGDRLRVEGFTPHNLLRRLPSAAEGDWRALVDSVFVDFDHDGGVLRPTLTDVATADRLVSGDYAVPPGAGAIRVRITDILSDELELTVSRTGPNAS